jgi:chemotaxis protein histidine kinase CheA
MAISRPLLIVLAVAVLALVGFYATSGARNASEPAEVATPVTPAPEPQAVEPKQSADAAKKVDAKSEHAKADRPKRAAAVSGPVAARRALRADKTVVLYFHGPASADESATARAVAGLDGKRGVTVIKAPIERLDAYQELIGQLGIAQAPAVVIVGRKRNARVIEGYIDPPTLAQDVADAR